MTLEAYQKYIGGEMKRKGRNHWALCPFYLENTSSFSIDPDKDGGVWHCLGCGKGGDMISLVAGAKGINNKQAIAFLAEELGLNENKEKPKFDKKTAQKIAIIFTKTKTGKQSLKKRF